MTAPCDYIPRTVSAIEREQVSIPALIQIPTKRTKSLCRCPVWVSAEALFLYLFCKYRRKSHVNTQRRYQRFCITMPLTHIIVMSVIEKVQVRAIIDKRIGKRVKQCRERLGISQEELAEKTGLTANYISTVERGMSFPRCEKLIILLNGLEVSADAIFCDVLEHSTSYKSSELSEKLASLSPQAQKRILQMVELMIQQETADNG